MFCRNCGTQLPDIAKFCNKCGTQVKIIPAPPVETEAKQEPTTPVTVVAPQPTPVVEQAPPSKVEVVQTPVVEQAPLVQEITEPTPVPVETEPVHIIPEPISEPVPKPIPEPEPPAVAPVIPETIPAAEPPKDEPMQIPPVVADPVPVAVTEAVSVEPAVTATEAPAEKPVQTVSDNRCPNCQCEITPGVKFCPECGSVIASQPSTTESVSQSSTDTSQVTIPTKQKVSWKVWLGIIIALVVLVGGISKCTSKINGTDENYINCAMQLTRENLKSPSSAIFYNCVVEEIDDYGRILVSLEFEAQNGFGAMIRNYAIVVLQDYHDGEFTYNPNFAVQFYKNTYEKSSTIELAKSLNKWNEPETED